MKYLLFILFCLSVPDILGQKTMLSPVEIAFLSNYAPEDITVVFVKGDKQAIHDFAISKKRRFSPASAGYYRLTLSIGELYELAELPFITQIDFSTSRGFALNDSARVINNVEPIYNGDSGLIQPFTGQDILIGVIDGGIDFTHRDFQFADSTTRVMMYWKQHDPYDAILTPAEYGYGRVYDSSMINAGSVGLYGQYLDHGCTVTGTAAGNANANGRHRGMAPDADLIVVSSNFNFPNWKASVADAVDFIINVADSLGKPVVINASLGDYLGSHDGLDPSALYIDSLLLAQPGRLMVAAAGNSGNQAPYHLGYTVGSDTSFTWFEHNPTTFLGYPGVVLEIWADTADLHNVDIAVSANKTSNGFDRRGLTGFYNVIGNINSIVYDTIWNNGNNLATVQYYADQRDGQYYVQITLDSPDSSQYDFGLLTTGDGHIDLWSAAWLGMNDIVTGIADSSVYPELVNYMFPDTLMSIVDSWNCSENVVSVANYYGRLSYIDYNNNPQTVGGTLNELSVGSSKGPSRNGLIKPDVAATGDMTLSAGSMSLLLYAQANNPQVLDVGGLHIRNGGTSMAAPVVSGIGALLLEKCPLVTTTDFINILQATSHSDAYTGTLPNYGFGYGKVDGMEALLLTNSTVNITGNADFCEGDSVQFTTLPIFNEYMWSNGDLTNQTFIKDSSQQVYLDVWNGIGCKAVSDTILVTEHSIPAVPTISQIGNSLLSSPGYSYQWLLNGVPISSADNQQHIAVSSGYYQVIIVDVYGCSNISDSLYVSITSIDEKEILFDIKPNPVIESFTIQTNGTGPYVYEVYDQTGKLLLSGFVRNSENIDMSSLSAGVYVLNVKDSEIIHQHRIVKL